MSETRAQSGALGAKFTRVLALAGSMSLFVAPFQCPHDPDPKDVREDTPGEALYGLAHQFGDAGDKAAEIRTLMYIVDRYPRSRFAVRARDELKGLGVAEPEPSIKPDMGHEGVPMGRFPGDPSSTPSAVAAPPPSASASASAK